MAQAEAKAQSLIQADYSVYIYHLPENQHEGQNDWEMRSVSADMSAAMTEAARLFKSRNFKKVEVKQRQHNPYTQSVKAKTVKVFDLYSHEKPALRWLAAFGLALGACAAGYLF